MRILFSSSPFAGHLFPLLPLARAAREGGHEIAVLTSEPLAPLLDPGIEVLPAGPMPDVLLAEGRLGRGPTRHATTHRRSSPSCCSPVPASTWASNPPWRPRSAGAPI